MFKTVYSIAIITLTSGSLYFAAVDEDFRHHNFADIVKYISASGSALSSSTSSKDEEKKRKNEKKH
jgi:hypothetical protein